MKKQNWILIISACLFMAFLVVGTLVKEDVDFSENENRYLEKSPSWNIKDILSGKFEENSEKYFNDQIIGREFWVKLMASTENEIGIKDINGTYVADGNRLVQNIGPKDFDNERYEKNLAQVGNLRDELKEENIPVQLMLAPTAAYVYREALPPYAITFDEDKAFDKAKETLGEDFLDLRKTMRETPINSKRYTFPYRGDKYFLTDHHWTNYGAFLAYCQYGELLGKRLTYRDYNAQTVLTEDFKGTLYSKVLFNEQIKDVIETPAYAMNEKYQVEIEGKTYPDLYFDEKLETKDKYQVYFGGNYDRVDIEAGGKKGKLLIIKDSYANSFTPHLLQDFSEITLIDTRFFRGNVTELAQEYDRVLVLYSINNFAMEKLSFNGGMLG